MTEAAHLITNCILETNQAVIDYTSFNNSPYENKKFEEHAQECKIKLQSCFDEMIHCPIHKEEIKRIKKEFKENPDKLLKEALGHAGMYIESLEKICSEMAKLPQNEHDEFLIKENRKAVQKHSAVKKRN